MYVGTNNHFGHSMILQLLAEKGRVSSKPLRLSDALNVSAILDNSPLIEKGSVKIFRLDLPRSNKGGKRLNSN